MPDRRTTIELLAPAGSYETFLAVLAAGADAVYLGGGRFGARAYADNLTEKEILSAVDEAHIHGKRVYLTVNTLVKEQELSELYAFLLPFYRQGLDAVIVQDIGALAFVAREFPGLAIHASTQMTVTGSEGAMYVKSLGADRVVTAREMSLAEIKRMHERVDIEIETFVHGALCYCYSGQCLLSSMIGGRSGNRGRCAQPCRLPYEAYDRNRQRVETPGKYLLSTKDLCGIADIPALAESGVNSLKIEGRMKQTAYAAGVVEVYRRNVDRYLALLAEAEERGEGEQALSYAAARYEVPAEDRKRLLALGNRSGFTDRYYFQRNGADMITFGTPSHERNPKEAEGEAHASCRGESKEKIKGILTLQKDAPVRMEVRCGACVVRREGAMVQSARTQPLSREKVEECIRKTGNTPFLFEELTVSMDADAFLPVQALNALRRDALQALADALAGAYRRDEKSAAGRADRERQVCAKTEEECLIASVEERCQLAEALEHASLTDIYLDSSLYARGELPGRLLEDVGDVRRRGKRAYYILPAVFRAHTADFYRGLAEELRGAKLDGMVAKSYDAAAFVRETFGAGMPLVLDHNLYIWNQETKEKLWELAPIRDTAPLELNRRELAGRDNEGSEILIYGYLPLMTTAQCIHAQLSGHAQRGHKGCDGLQTALCLRDRYGKYFTVKNRCAECYNTLYNSAPLMLFGYREELLAMGIRAFRLSFTTEDRADVRRILSVCEELFDARTAGKQGAKPDGRLYGEYTNGHYKRGVE